MKRFALFIGLTTFVFFLNAYGDIHKAIFVFKNGTTTYEDSNTWSISWVDFNNDGYDDLFLPTNNSNQFNYLYQNNKGVFDTVQKTFLTDIPLQVVSANWGDVNNDGLKDVLIGQNINGQNDLFIQNCDGTFSKNEINRASKNNKFTHSTNWVDYNLDGNLDAFITEYSSTGKNTLLQNNGNLNFQNVFEGVLRRYKGFALGGVWSDVNNDLYPDLFLPNNKGYNILYINQQGKGFRLKLMNKQSPSVGCSFGDIDNDLDFDLVVANASATHNYLYINDGAGNFTLAANSLVTKEKGDSHGTCFGDFDNDGWLDLIITNDAKTETYFYLNDGQGDFVRNTNQIFDQVMGKSFGVASTDFDLDGDLDIYIANHSNQANYFYTNTKTTYNWVGFLLTGTKSNRDAIGAKVKIKAQINGESVWQIREIRSQSGGMGAQNSNKAHFGLHKAEKVDSLVIDWPSGLNQVFENIKINKYYQVEEGKSKLKTRLGNKLYKDCEKSSLRKAAKEPDCKVKLYPQPATDWLYIKHKDTFDSYLYSQSGKLLTQQKSNFNEASVYLKNYPVGMYVVNIHSPCGMITKRVIKN